MKLLFASQLVCKIASKLKSGLSPSGTETARIRSDWNRDVYFDWRDRQLRLLANRRATEAGGFLRESEKRVKIGSQQ
jgi:hypothetical protein